MNPSTTHDTDFHVGQIVELQAQPCRLPCPADCGCVTQAARNGHQGAVLNIQLSLDDANDYYQIDGLDFIVYGDELRAVEPAVQA